MLELIEGALFRAWLTVSNRRIDNDYYGWGGRAWTGR